MLTNLAVSGLAIIDKLEIKFENGLNVLTGETGTGKSVLIKALTFLLGNKSSPDMIRKGAEVASVSAAFCVPSFHPALLKIKELGLVSIDSKSKTQETVIRRQMTSNGRTSAWINDIPVTLTTLKDFSELLLDVFGQHDSHKLWSTDFHTSYLDSFLGDQTILAKHQEHYDSFKQSLKKVEAIALALKEGKIDVEFERFRLDELNQFNPSETEFDKLMKQGEIVRHKAKSFDLLKKLSEAIHGESEQGLLGRLKEFQKIASSSKLQGLIDQESLLNLHEPIEKLSFEIDKMTQSNESDEIDIDTLESRLATYQKLMRKHSVGSVAELMMKCTELQTRLYEIENQEKVLADACQGLLAVIAELRSVGVKLTSERVKASKQVSKIVANELQELAMVGASFEVKLHPAHSRKTLDMNGIHDERYLVQLRKVNENLAGISPSGAESAEFLIAANAGEERLSLAKVASGGEMSRVMLALKKALTIGADTCVLVFDEIDTGISGRVADVVGNKIRELSSFCQIICISHLAQVAAYANHHFVVEKKVKNDRIEASIREIGQTERISELAKLLSGSELSKTSLANAKALLEMAKSRFSVSGTAKMQKPTLAAAVKSHVPKPRK